MSVEKIERPREGPLTLEKKYKLLTSHAIT